MVFKFGVYGFERSALENISGPVLNEPTSFSGMRFRNNFVEFDAEGLLNGLDVINKLAGALKRMYPREFDSSKTKIWVDGHVLDVCLLSKLTLAEAGMKEAIQLLRQGRAKEPMVSNKKAQGARLKLQQTLKALKL